MLGMKIIATAFKLISAFDFITHIGIIHRETLN